MSLYRLNQSQIDTCRAAIRAGYEQKVFSRADRDRYLKLLNAPSSARALVIYIGLQLVSGQPDEDFCSYLPKPLSEYKVPLSMMDVLSGVFVLPESLLPRERKPSKSTKKLYSFQIESSDLDDLKALADSEGRTVSGTLRMLVRKYLKESANG